MSKVTVTESYLSETAEAIRGKLGTDVPYTPAQFAAAIGSIPTGSTAVMVSKTITANGTYDPAADNADGYDSVVVNVPGGGGAYPYITADYAGLSYGYIATGGTFQSYTSKQSMLNVYDLTAGTYCFFVGQTVSNRLRAHFYNGKSLSDFSEYIENSHAQATVYTCNINITGGTDLAGDQLLERIFFTTNTAGALIVGTSFESIVAPSMLFKIA